MLLKRKKNFCPCGCGKKPNKGKTYVHGHNSRFRSPESLERIVESVKERWGNPKFRRKMKIIKKKSSVKISKTLIEKWGQEDYRNYMMEVRKSKRTYEKISKSLKADWQDPNFIKKHSGKNANHYIDGSSINYINWQTAVFKRDNYTCQECFKQKRGKKIHAHHIKPKETYPELMYVVDNGQTLCSSCHPKKRSNIKIKKEGKL